VIRQVGFDGMATGVCAQTHTANVKLLEYGPKRMSILSSRRSWNTFFRAVLISLWSSYQMSRTKLFFSFCTVMPP
jgi:hypothetical protein